MIGLIIGSQKARYCITFASKPKIGLLASAYCSINCGFQSISENCIIIGSSCFLEFWREKAEISVKVLFFSPCGEKSGEKTVLFTGGKRDGRLIRSRSLWGVEGSVAR